MKEVAIIGIQGLPAQYGGYETQVENMIGENQSPNVHYTIFNSSKDQKSSLEVYKGATMKYINLPSHGVWSIPYYTLSYLKSFRKFDTILQLGLAGGFFLPIFKLFNPKVKVIVNVDGIEHRRDKFNKFGKWLLLKLEQFDVKFADVIISDNEGIKENQLLDSILNQTNNDWKMIIRDDGSTDSTIAIIKDYINKFENKFFLIEDTLGNLGTSASNDLLMHSSESEYFMFCDQDDIWKPEKIDVCLEAMHNIERTNQNIPILICSDACCIDEHNKLICDSFFSSQKFIDTTDNLYKMLALNIVQGSTTLMNSEVRDVVKFIPKNYLHDAWVACIVKYYGIVQYIHRPLLEYRQHGGNVLGALDVGPRYLSDKMIGVFRLIGDYKRHFNNLPFHVSMFKWLYYKLLINIRRL